ncbi:MAG TPA: hypothetical protein VK112_14090, partial [Fodinibius sp.]|nr:hypothetical protein [Fodinibius sp.]
TDTGIRFKSTRGRGGIVENIDIHNIYMQDIVTEPIRFNLYYGGEAPSPGQEAKVVDKETLRRQFPEVTEETPQFRNIQIRNIYSYDSKTALWIQGLPEMNVENVNIENVEFTADRGGMIMDADQITMRNVKLRVNKGPILYLNNVHNLDLEEVALGYEKSSEAGTGIRIAGPFTETVYLSDVSFDNTNENLSIGPNVQESTIVE